MQSIAACTPLAGSPAVCKSAGMQIRRHANPPACKPAGMQTRRQVHPRSFIQYPAVKKSGREKIRPWQNPAV